jgi:hypothetical protein
MQASVDHAQRRELLRANGKDPRLIRDLLGDAQLWDLLRESCSRQIFELTEFQNSYKSKPWTALREQSIRGEEQLNDDEQSFLDEIGHLEKAQTQGLETLMKASQNLIELVLAESLSDLKEQSLIDGRSSILRQLWKHKSQRQLTRA